MESLELFHEIIKMANAAIDKLKAERDNAARALKEIAEGQHCSACSCECHAVAKKALSL
jgi:hypothetical protein